MHKCIICNGSGESKSYQLNDCTAKGCTAATERAALEAAIKAAEAMTPYDERWMAYQQGKAAALKDARNYLEDLPDGVWANTVRLK